MLAGASPALADTGPIDPAAYLKARAADADGHVAVAAEAYGRVLQTAPSDPAIALRAYRAALDAGNYDLADTAARTLTQAGVAPADAALLALAEAVRTGDSRASDAAIDRIGGGPLAFMVPILRAWKAYGDHRDPLPLLAGATQNPLATRFVSENRALLLIATGQTDAGIAAMRATLGLAEPSDDFRFDAAQLLAAKGKRELALSLLAGDDPVLVRLRATLGDGVKPSFAFGVSRLFTRLASDLTHGDPTPLSVVLTRGALRVEPDNDRAKLLLAETLEGEGATTLSLATLDAIDPNGPFGDIADAARVAVLGDAGDDAHALAAAKTLAEAPQASAEDAQRYGDELIDADRFGDAAQAYATAIQRRGANAGWALYLQQGGALEQAGDWAQARTALQKAVALAPDEPLALNYLGYADIEHGEDVAQALALLRKASALKPGDPAITDSLGWAYLKQGDTAQALPLFERAVQGQPADETINEHLGDAYWRTGRLFEARYAWRAAAVAAEPAARARLAAKLAGGLPPGPIAH